MDITNTDIESASKYWYPEIDYGDISIYQRDAFKEGALWCLKTMNPDLEYTIATGSPVPDMSGRDRYVLTCTKTFTTLADALSYWETLPPGMSDRHFIVCRRVLPDDSAEWFKV